MDRNAAFLVQIAESWVGLRKVKLAYTGTNKASPKQKEMAGDAFPRAIGWWTWFNDELVELVGKNTMLSAPIFKAYELHNGVAWQLTERFTEKPKPALLKELRSLLPGNPPLRVVIGV